MITQSLMQKIKQTSALLITIIVIGVTVILPLKEAFAANTYIPLSTIPGITKACVPGANGDTSGCEPANPTQLVSNAYTISIGIAAILAIGMIIWAGIQYATTEAITGKSEAKKHWQGAILGLLLLISSYLILRTINLDLVQQDLTLGNPIVCTPTTDASGRLVPCGVAREDANIEQVRQTLGNQRTQIDTALETATQLVQTKEQELEAAKASDSSEEELQRLESELSVARNQQNLAQFDMSVNNTYSAITTALGRGVLNFNTVAKENNSTALATMVNNFSLEAKNTLDTAESLKTAEGRNLFTPEQISAMRSSYDTQLQYMDAYVQWKGSGSSTAAPVAPVVTLPPPPQLKSVQETTPND